jgi:hypothetical protein
VPSKGRRVIRELAPRFATQLQTAINEQGVGVALFDSQLAVRIGRGVGAEAQVVGPDFESVQDVVSPILLQVDRQSRFLLVATRSQADGTKLEIAFAGPDGRFGAPTIDYVITERLATAWPVFARNEAGDEVFVWASGDRPDRRDSGPVRAVVRRDGQWSAPVDLSPDVRGYLAAAIGADGTALVAYARADAPLDPTRMVTAVAPRGQSFTEARAVPDSLGVANPSAAVDGHGRLVVSWIGGARDWRSEAAVAMSGAAFGRPITLADHCLYPDLRLDGVGRTVALMDCHSYFPPRDYSGERVLLP